MNEKQIIAKLPEDLSIFIRSPSGSCCFSFSLVKGIDIVGIFIKVSTIDFVNGFYVDNQSWLVILITTV